MSLRWTASKAAILSFPYKKSTSLEESVLQSLFMWKLSAAKLSGIHWPIYLCTNGWWGMSLCMWIFLTKWPTPLYNGDFQSIFARSSTSITASEKSSIITKSTTTFPMSLRWTAYVAPNPLKGPQRRQFFFVFCIKMDFARRSLLQSFFVWTLSAAKL